MAKEANKPVKIFKLKGVKIAVFENHAESDGRDVVFHKVALQKIYKEGEQFKTTTSLGQGDIPIAVLLLQRSWEWILDAESNKGEQQE